MESHLILKNALTQAIMEDTPLIIVEGVDDKQIYEQVAKAAGLEKYKIRPIEDFVPQYNNCEAIISEFEKIQPQLLESPEYQSSILGIIDRDSRPYVKGADFERIQGLVCLYILEFYSIESYFVNEYYTLHTIKNLTNLTENDIRNRINALGQDLTVYLYSKYKQLQKDSFLHEVALEALKNEELQESSDIALSNNACKSADYRKKFSAYFQNQHKIQELNDYATSKGINPTSDSLWVYCKGKWLSEDFFQTLISLIKNIEKECTKNIGNIPRCANCTKEGQLNKCYYKQNNHTNPSNLYKHLKNIPIDPIYFSNLIIAFKKLIS